MNPKSERGVPDRKNEYANSMNNVAVFESLEKLRYEVLPKIAASFIAR